MINKDLTLYPEALELKQLGFDEPCFKFYIETGELIPASYSKEGTVYPSNSDLLPEWIASPTYSQAFRWFRDTHNCHHTIKFINEKYVGIAYSSVVNFSIDEFDTYEEAELECLKELIKIVKEGNK